MTTPSHEKTKWAGVEAEKVSDSFSSSSVFEMIDSVH